MPNPPEGETKIESAHTMYVGPSRLGATADRVHYLIVESGSHIGQRFLLGDAATSLGREPPCDIVLRDQGVSRLHCRIERRFEQLVVTDLDSTNGSFIDGKQAVGTMMFPVGSVLEVGEHVLRHAFGTRKEYDDAVHLERELQEALAYVKALLPPPWRDGPLRTEWLMLPSAKLGGDALGYHAMGSGRYAIYLVDVSGHGARAAMHTVSVINTLRHHSLPRTDFARPSDVLKGLNAMFGMEQHGDMYFTIWYGVYDTELRKLQYATGGHHPGFLRTPDSSELIRLQTPNIPVGTLDDFTFAASEVEVPPGSRLYLFSDGVFELVRPDGTETSLKDLVMHLMAPSIPDVPETVRIHRAACETQGKENFDDDFTIIVADFE